MSNHDHVSEGWGERLRQAREAAGLSQRELSFPGCTAVYICRIEKGQRVPSLQVAEHLAARLNCDPEWLCHGTGTPEPKLVLRLPTGGLAPACVPHWIVADITSHATALLEGYAVDADQMMLGLS